MKAAVIGVMILAALPALLPALAAPGTDAALGEIQTALDKGDAGQARSLADAALGETGLEARGRARLLLYRGLAEELAGAADPAAADFTAALSAPTLPAEERAQALLQRGFLRDGQGRLDQALADYTAVIGLKGVGMAIALNNRGNIYRRQNRLAQARRDYLAALELGRSQYAYYGLGQIAEAQHDTLAARGFYANAVAADPDYALASQRLAALGGPPDGTIAQAGPILLKPSPVMLHPPVLHSSARKTQKIVLHPPKPQAAARPAPWRRAAASQVGKDEELGGLVILRPALDTPAPPFQSPSHGPEVQLGAWRSEAEARAGWAKAQARAGGLLNGLSPHIVTADLPGRGRYYRLRTDPPGKPGDFCVRLATKGVTCLPARN